MIFNLLILAVSTIFVFIGQFLPLADPLTATQTDQLSSLGLYFYMLDQLIAIPVLFTGIIAVFTLEIILASLNIARWIVRTVPFLNSRI